MLLTLDIGNTEITLGLFRERELEAHWRLTTNPDRTPDEWAASIAAFLDHAGRSPNEVRASCLASVAPAVTQSIVEGVEKTTGCVLPPHACHPSFDCCAARKPAGRR